MLSYFESGLCTWAAILTAQHQQRLHAQNSVLLQLYYIWRKENAHPSDKQLNIIANTIMESQK